ncbi:hypothetical protein DPMN_085289 [Dreissena polymorpha]|uniref:Uncharacterized protein n=1 Tax=Dreissena polymorpha TaxID=45954 RepID=A0A9D4BK60_DREPO|nr:hypothetical protein DPMN_085289 [Dreissena polymorpha]
MCSCFIPPQASMWPSIPLVVNPATIGTAMGLTTSIQMIGIGISNLVVGQILGKGRDVPVSRWNFVMMFLLANTLACITASLFLNINDRRKGGVLNLSRKQKQALTDGGKGTTVQAADGDSSSEDEREPLLTNRK